jgi:hypothetical protein
MGSIIQTRLVKFCDFGDFTKKIVAEILVEKNCKLAERFLHRDEDGEAAAEEKVVAEQNYEALVEGTEEEQRQANPRYKTTTNTPTKRPARSTCLESTSRLTSNHPKAK